MVSHLLDPALLRILSSEWKFRVIYKPNYFSSFTCSFGGEASIWMTNWWQMNEYKHTALVGWERGKNQSWQKINCSSTTSSTTNSTALVVFRIVAYCQNFATV
jgi:hypothetical protein